MFIERNLYSPLRMQIERIIKKNNETATLADKVDKDRPKQQKQHNNNQEKDKQNNQQEIAVSEDATENRKLDLIA